MDNFDVSNMGSSQVSISEVQSLEFNSNHKLNLRDSSSKMDVVSTNYNCEDDLSSVCKAVTSSDNGMLCWNHIGELTSGNLPSIKEIHTQLFNTSNANLASSLLSTDDTPRKDVPISNFSVSDINNSFQSTFQQIVNSTSTGLLNSTSTSISYSIPEVKIDQLNYMNILSCESDLETSGIGDCPITDVSIPPISRSPIGLESEELTSVNGSNSNFNFVSDTANYTNLESLSMQVGCDNYVLSPKTSFPTSLLSPSGASQELPNLNNVLNTAGVSLQNSVDSIFRSSSVQGNQTTIVPSIKKIITCPTPVQIGGNEAINVSRNATTTAAIVDQNIVNFDENSLIEQITCFRCKMCSFISVQKNDLLQHIRDVHQKASKTQVNAQKKLQLAKINESNGITVQTNQAVSLPLMTCQQVTDSKRNENIPVSLPANKPIETVINANNSLLKFLCPYCSDTLNSLQAFNTHLLAQHKVVLNLKKNVNEPKKATDQNKESNAKNNTISNIAAAPVTTDSDVANKKLKSELKCSLCPKVFESISQYNAHMQADHHPANKEPAKLQEVAQASVVKNNDVSKKVVQNLEDRVVNVSSDEIPAEFKKNLKSRKNGDGFICAVKRCNISFSKQENLKYHEKCHVHSVTMREFLCPECQMKTELWRHMAMHLWKSHSIDLDLYKCDFCDYRTWSYYQLHTAHTLIHGDARKFLCDVCGKSFKTFKQMRNHKMWHTKNPKKKQPSGVSHLCDICGKSFRLPAILKKHKEVVHDKIKQFLCSYCGYSASNHSTLKIHIRVHTGEKPYSCDVCPYKSVDHNSLRRHKMKHSGEKPYKCPYCKYACIQSCTYKAHLKRKHLVKDDGLQFSCSYCNFKAIRKDILDSHIKDSHVGDSNDFAVPQSGAVNTEQVIVAESNPNAVLTFKDISVDQLYIPSSSEASHLDANIQNLLQSNECQEVNIQNAPSSSLVS